MSIENKENNSKGMTFPAIIFAFIAIGVFVIFILFDLSEPWPAFLGSYSGGIIGTLGVIYVAHRQGNQQLNHFESVERNERIRLKTEIQLNKVYAYHDVLQALDSDSENLKETINILYLLLPSGHFSNSTNSKEFSDEILIYLNRISHYKENHFSQLISKVKILNETLSNDSELSLEDPSTLNDYKSLDHTLKNLNESSKFIQKERNPNGKASIISNLKASIDNDVLKQISEIEEWIAEEKKNFNSNLTELMERLN